jgi:ketosteroid isomerase-like protein
MTAATVEAEVLDLERQFWQALKDDDVEAAVRLTDEPSLLAGPQGVNMIDRKTFKKMMKEAPYSLDRFELKEGAQVRLLSDDVAIVGYEVTEQMTVDGKPETLEAVESSVWVRRDGRWLCAMHTEALKGDPFGRDRRR